MCSACLQIVTTLNDGAEKERVLVEVTAFFKYPTFNILIHIKNDLIRDACCQDFFQGLQFQTNEPELECGMIAKVYSNTAVCVTIEKDMALQQQI